MNYQIGVGPMFASLQTTVSIIATNAIYTKKTCFEYADVVWNNCAQYESNELEKNSEWSCTYCHRGNKVSLNFNNSLLLETGWENLSSRKNKYKLTFFSTKCKTIFLLITSAHLYLLPSYPLRNALDLQILHTYSQLYYNSILPFANGVNSRKKNS